MRQTIAIILLAAAAAWAIPASAMRCHAILCGGPVLSAPDEPTDTDGIIFVDDEL